MAVMIYNPKTFGGKPSSPIKGFLVRQKDWRLGVNEIKKFPNDVGEAMLDRFKFLERVEPEDLQNIKKQMEEKNFKCPHCPAEFSSNKELHGHKIGKHKLSKESEDILSSIPDAEAFDSEYVKQKQASPEQAEGIPKSGKDADGVDWYGAGVQEDTPSMKKAEGTF